MHNEFGVKHQTEPLVHRRRRRRFHRFENTNSDLLVCLDCAGNYTEEELFWSLIVLSIIVAVFLLILCSQCCSRLRARLSDDEKCSTIPAPVYRRNTERRIYRI